ncbi:MAG TPA: hypothetical protein VK194_05010, partial [Candidatus Deferrimicrobium sp.]|nr:hypothetical protein [Candidatus Deferrimicrobium sp.]
MTTLPRVEADAGSADAPGDLRLRRLDLDSDAPADVAERQALVRRGVVPEERIRAGARAILADVR